MKHANLLVGIAVALLVGGAAGYWWAQHANPGTNEAKKIDQRAVLYWHDPMVPATKFDKPGKSPFMNMQLVPVYADQAASPTGVSVNANVQQNLGIRLAKVESAALPNSLAAVGTVAFDEHDAVVVQSRVAATVARLLVKATLAHVRRGQSLIELAAPEWLEAEGEYLVLLADDTPAAMALRAAARQRLVVLGVPQSAIAQIERHRVVPPTVTLSAPIDGVITELAVREGAGVSAGAALFRINGLSRVWVQAAVPELQLGLVPMNSMAALRANAWPGVTFSGRVKSILPQVDPATRAIPVRITVKNADSRLSPGMFVNVTFRGGDEPAKLVVPSDAVIMTGERSVVIVSDASGSFSVANVKVGREANGKTIILSGLTAGQSVVASGQFLIDSEASLTATVDRLTAVQSHAVSESPSNDAQRLLHLGQGTVTAISPTALTISHDSIPSLNWGPMTMTFARSLKPLPAELKAGDVVTFSFGESADGYQLDAVEVLTPAAGKSP